MKLRHKQSGVEIDVSVTPKPVDFQKHEHFGTWDGSLYSKSEWEVVKPEPVWRDVTHECELFTGLWHGNRKLFDVPDGYRIRTVVSPGLKGGYMQGYAAFIIEKREP